MILSFLELPCREQRAKEKIDSRNKIDHRFIRTPTRCQQIRKQGRFKLSETERERARGRKLESESSANEVGETAGALGVREKRRQGRAKSKEKNQCNLISSRQDSYAQCWCPELIEDNASLSQERGILKGILKGILLFFLPRKKSALISCKRHSVQFQYDLDSDVYAIP